MYEWILSLTVGQILGYLATAFAVVCSIIEFNKKLKWNPISSVLKWIGTRTNVELLDELKDVKSKVTDVEGRVESLEHTVNRIDEDADRRDAVQCRVRILRFGDELRINHQHSKDSFDQVLSDLDQYDRYCEAHPNFRNNQTAATRERILNVYNKRLSENDFI